MSFNQLTINVNSELAEALSELFFELGALSVTIEDQYEGTELEQPIFNEPGMEVEKLWAHSKVIVLLELSCDELQLVQQVEAKLGIKLEAKLTEVDDQDWVRLTQSQFQPIEVTPNLYIVPSWHELPKADATGIILDPGLAFGTGSHPTTFMCLRWLAENIQRQHAVLDYGCGSGILAITAKKLGAMHVDGVDIDPQAIEASLHNATVNNCLVNFYLPNEFVPNEFEHQGYDVVIANILANPLRLLAGALASYTASGGQIILSGILAAQIEEMSEIYNQWFTMTTYMVSDGWACLHGQRR